MKKFIFCVILVVLGLVWFYDYRVKQAHQLPEYIAQSNGRLELARLDVATLYAGRVKNVLVNEGDSVTADEVLVELSSEQSNSQLVQAQAAQAQVEQGVKKADADAIKAREAVVQAQAAVARSKENVVKADANINLHKQQLKMAQLNLDNAQKLKRDELVSQVEVQQRIAERDGALAAIQAAQASHAEALAGVQAAQAQVAAAQAAVAQSQAQIGEAKAGVARAKAQVDAAYAANNDMYIRSPIAGRVEYRLTEAGSVIGAGNKVISLLDPSQVSMNIFLPHTKMVALKVGDEARIVLDGIDAVFPAKIAFVATNAQFTPKSVETVNERAKFVFKVKLQIQKEVSLKYNGLLKGGMTGNGYVRTNSQREWTPELTIKLPN